jgi:hypothetical protein
MQSGQTSAAIALTMQPRHEEEKGLKVKTRWRAPAGCSPSGPTRHGKKPLCMNTDPI